MTGAVYSDGDTYLYDYDKVGNRTSQTINGIETTYAYDELNRLTNAGGVPFSWDANGNLLNDGTNTYTYDFVNRLTGINGQGSVYSFAYDGVGNRYQQTANGNTTTYLLDLSGDLSQVLSDGTATYYYGLERIAQQVNSGTYEYFLPDLLGSVRQIAGDNQFPSYSQSYDPYGSLISWEGKGGSSYGYAGETNDPPGLVFLRARYYSPELDIFLSRDPFPGILSIPASLNPYPYAFNNPVLYTDPTGENPLAIIAFAGFIVGTVLDTYIQTDGFKNFCDIDVLELIAAGAGGAVAAMSLVVLSVTGVGYLGLGMQGIAISLFGIGVSAPVITQLWFSGSNFIGWSDMASSWLLAEANLPKLAIDSKKMPNISKNISNAQANGAPKILTRTENQSIIEANRRIACERFCGVGSPDEYPFASTYEGGQGAFVTGVPLNEQNIQGGY